MILNPVKLQNICIGEKSEHDAFTFDNWLLKGVKGE